MFIGREKELNKLKESFENGQTVGVVYGKRRVGKTALLLESSRYFKGDVIYVQCAETSIEENIENLRKEIIKIEGFPLGHFSSFEELFDSLSKSRKRILIIIDEYSYLKNIGGARAIDSIFQRIIATLSSNVSLIICGSYVHMMKELNERGNPLFGRFNLSIELSDMNYRQSSEFYPSFSFEDKIRFYSIFGGSPFANSNLKLSLSLKENIKNLFLESGGILRNYVENILLNEFSKGTYIQNVLETLNKRKKRYGELEKDLGIKTAGLLDKKLKALLENDIIEKVYPINKLNDKSKTFYSIKDNIALFYYTFIFPNRNSLDLLGPETFYKEYIEEKIEDYIHFRFEEIVKEYLVCLVREGKMKDVLDIGRYWYDDPKSHKNGDIDIALKKRNNKYDIFKAKYLKDKMDVSMVHHEIEQIKEIPFLKVDKIGLASLHGFDFEDPSLILISGEDLYM